jgi:hypothetical protein
MSLDTIQPKDVPRGRVYEFKDEDLSLKTMDIERAQPYYNHKRYLEKPTFTVGITDPGHVGGKARTYYPEMDRRPRDLSLTTADIEYAQPKSVKAKGNRHTDPLQPQYELPSCNVRPQTPPRWNGRYTNDISDIELSNPKKLIPDRNYIRDPNDASDIEYACPNYKARNFGPMHAESHSTSLDVRDITENKKTAPRGTNPLEPVYKVPTSTVTSLPHTWTEEGGTYNVQQAPMEAHTVGPVAGSRPRKLQWDNGEPLFSLLREDIAGAAPQRWIGAVPFNIYDPPSVKPAISFHDPHDIPGAQVGTLKKGIEGSYRTLNPCDPLQPDYQLLDGQKRPAPSPVPQGYGDPYVEAERGHPKPGKGPSQHPTLQRAGANSMSLPNLHQRTRPFDTAHAHGPNGTPLGSAHSSAQHSQRSASNAGTPTRIQRPERLRDTAAGQIKHGRAPPPLPRVQSDVTVGVGADHTRQMTPAGKGSFRGQPPSPNAQLGQQQQQQQVAFDLTKAPPTPAAAQYQQGPMHDEMHQA